MRSFCGFRLPIPVGKLAATATTLSPTLKPTISSLDDTTDAILDKDGEHIIEVEDEYDSWLKEPTWTSD
jgi:hypothetical protein